MIFSFFIYFFLKRNATCQRKFPSCLPACPVSCILLNCRMFVSAFLDREISRQNVKVVTLSFLWQKNLIKASPPHVYCLHTISSLVGSKFSANIQIPTVFSDILMSSVRKRKERERRKKSHEKTLSISLSLSLCSSWSAWDRLQEFLFSTFQRLLSSSHPPQNVVVSPLHLQSCLSRDELGASHLILFTTHPLLSLSFSASSFFLPLRSPLSYLLLHFLPQTWCLSCSQINCPHNFVSFSHDSFSPSRRKYREKNEKCSSSSWMCICDVRLWKDTIPVFTGICPLACERLWKRKKRGKSHILLSHNWIGVCWWCLMFPQQMQNGAHSLLRRRLSQLERNSPF